MLIPNVSVQGAVNLYGPTDVLSILPFARKVFELCPITWSKTLRAINQEKLLHLSPTQGVIDTKYIRLWNHDLKQMACLLFG